MKLYTFCEETFNKDLKRIAYLVFVLGRNALILKN